MSSEKKEKKQHKMNFNIKEKLKKTFSKEHLKEVFTGEEQKKIININTDIKSFIFKDRKTFILSGIFAGIMNMAVKMYRILEEPVPFKNRIMKKNKF